MAEHAGGGPPEPPDKTDARRTAIEEKVAHRRRQLRAVEGKLPTPPGGHARTPTVFGPGNKAAVGSGRGGNPVTRPKNRVEEFDQIAAQTIARLKRFHYVEQTQEDGTVVKKQVQLAAPVANAIFVGLRLRLDIFAQHLAGEELARLQREFENLQARMARALPNA